MSSAACRKTKGSWREEGGITQPDPQDAEYTAGGSLGRMGVYREMSAAQGALNSSPIQMSPTVL